MTSYVISLKHDLNSCLLEMLMIPKGTTTLHFTDLAFRSLKEIKEIFAKIPRSVSILSLNHNRLAENKNRLEIIECIPDWITTLNLSHNHLELLTQTELEAFFKSFKQTIEILDLSENFSIIKSNLNAFKTISSSIRSLTLSIYSSKTDCEQLGTYVSLLPQSLIELTILTSSLHRHSAEKVTRLFCSIKDHIKTLTLVLNLFDLSSNHNITSSIPKSVEKLSIVLGEVMYPEYFYQLSGKLTHVKILEIVNLNLGIIDSKKTEMLFKTLPKSLTGLGLLDCGIHNFPQETLTTLIQLFPSTLRSLNLSGHFFGNDFDTFEQLIQLLKKSQLTSLQFSNCNLGALSAKQFKTALSHLSPLITSLDLSENFSWTDKDVRKARLYVSAIPESVSAVNFSKNKLTGLPLEMQLDLFQAFSSITSMSLGKNFLAELDHDEAITSVFSYYLSTLFLEVDCTKQRRLSREIYQFLLAYLLKDLCPLVFAYLGIQVEDTDLKATYKENLLLPLSEWRIKETNEDAIVKTAKDQIEQFCKKTEHNLTASNLKTTGILLDIVSSKEDNQCKAKRILKELSLPPLTSAIEHTLLGKRSIDELAEVPKAKRQRHTESSLEEGNNLSSASWFLSS